MASSSQSFSAFGSSGIDHSATTSRFHAGTETVGAGSFQITWLKCSFHDFYLFSLTRQTCFMHASKKAVHHTVFLLLFQVFFDSVITGPSAPTDGDQSRLLANSDFSLCSAAPQVLFMARFYTVYYGFVVVFLVY